MGTDLNVFKYGEYISGLGRLYHYEIDNRLTLDADEINTEIEKVKADMKLKLGVLAVYSPKNIKEVHGITQDIELEVDLLCDELMKLGKLNMLSYMTYDEGVTIKPDS